MTEKGRTNEFVHDEELADLLTQKCDPDYVWRQLAEECMELAHAALKMVRTQKGEATDMNKSDAVHNLIEEMADTILMADIALEFVGDNGFNSMIEIDQRKRVRMRDRLEAMPDKVNRGRWKLELKPTVPDDMNTRYCKPEATADQVQAFVDFLLDRFKE